MAHLRSIRRAQTPNPQALGITVPLPFGKPGTPRSPRAVARTKKNPGGEPGLSLGRTLGVFTLPDSPAAGRKVSRLPSSLDGPALPLGSLPAGQSLAPAVRRCHVLSALLRAAFSVSAGGKSQSWIAYPLCFGRFLNFTTTVVNDESVLANLTEALSEFYHHGDTACQPH